MNKRGGRKRSVIAEDKVMFLSNFQCCVCKERGDQIHHLDGKSANTVEDNLVLLCLMHHADASERSTMRRKFSAGALRQTRHDHYARIEKWRGSFVRSISEPIGKPQVFDLVQASITANALLEIERIEHDFLYGDRGKREEVLTRLNPYSKYDEPRIGFAVLEFVVSAAHHARFGFSRSDCGSLVWMAIHFFPSSNKKGRGIDPKRSADLALSAGRAIVYDAAIHLRKYYPALEGLTLIKYVHQLGQRKGHKAFLKLASECLNGLLGQLDRPDRDDLVLVKRMIQEFRDNMNDGDLSLPIFSKEVMSALHGER